MPRFEELQFKIDENLETSATYDYGNGVSIKVVREKPTGIHQYRVHLLRNREPIKPDDKLQYVAENINFLHGPIGITCIMVGLAYERE